MAVLAFWIFCAVACGVAAPAKGRSARAWLILGTMFGMFAFLVLGMLPSVESDRAEVTA